jgi:uncharacterized protein RhaS with RHS repeats
VRFGARDYDPEIGRWTTPDPSGFAGGLNLYVYTDQNPQSFIDRNGENPVAIGIAAAWGLIEAGLTIWDVYEAGSTLMDPCASLGEKVFTGGLAAAGGIFPGAGYGAGGKAGKKALGAGKKAPNGGAFPSRRLPRTKHGDPIPDGTAPHSQLGLGRDGTPQAREWLPNEDGRLVPSRDIDFDDHGFPDTHPVPHEHLLTPNNPATAPRGGMQRGSARPLRYPDGS